MTTPTNSMLNKQYSTELRCVETPDKLMCNIPLPTPPHFELRVCLTSPHYSPKLKRPLEFALLTSIDGHEPHEGVQGSYQKDVSVGHHAPERGLASSHLCLLPAHSGGLILMRLSDSTERHAIVVLLVIYFT